MKKFLLCTAAIVLSAAMWTSCTKKESVTPSASVKKQVVNPSAPPPPLSFTTVDANLLADGWVSATLSPMYVPEYSGYAVLHYYTKGTQEAFVYQFVTWEAAEIAVDDDCPKDWNSGGGDDGHGGTVPSGCYNDGNECKVTLPDNNKLVIICC